MYVTCNKCKRHYNDAKQWTICPHSPLECAVDDLCPICDTLKSRHGPCKHQQSKGPRRCDLNRFTKAERAIWDAMQCVETTTGAHPLLTDAINLLNDARNKVADWVELDQIVTGAVSPGNPEHSSPAFQMNPRCQETAEEMFIGTPTTMTFQGAEAVQVSGNLVGDVSADVRERCTDPGEATLSPIDCLADEKWCADTAIDIGGLGHQMEGNVTTKEKNSWETVPRKIVQLVSYPCSDTMQQDMIVALCDDGSIWTLSLQDNSDWNQIHHKIPDREV